MLEIKSVGRASVREMSFVDKEKRTIIDCFVPHLKVNGQTYAISGPDEGIYKCKDYNTAIQIAKEVKKKAIKKMTAHE